MELHSNPRKLNENTKQDLCIEATIGEEPRRFLVLFLFLVLTGSNAFQWIQFTVVSEQVKILYNSTLPVNGRQFVIDTTATVFMFLYFVFIIPCHFLLEGKGLRTSIVIGSCLNATGTVIKCIAQHYLSFGALMFGQVISGLAETFTLGQPSHLAALWFRQEVASIVASIGVFANELGIAFGFIIPSVLVNRIEGIYNSTHISDEVFNGLKNTMLYGVAVPLCVVACIDCLLIVLFFPDKPKKPVSQAEVLRAENKMSVLETFKYLKGCLTNVRHACPLLMQSFIVLFFTYGLVVGVYYAFSVNVHKYYEENHPNNKNAAGIVGVIIVISGLVGSICAGMILSWSKKYRVVSIISCACSLIFMIIFTATLHLNVLIGYFISALLGFTMTGFLAIGFELAAEITYPTNEDISSGILNWSAQIFGIVLTYSHAAILENHKSVLSNIFLCVCLLLAVTTSAFVKKEYRRMEAEKKTDL
ncbi:hypothetical protein ACOME3_004697 [Neoechinorhynchus agilis]